MSTTKTFAGATYNLPLNREPKSSDWGTQVSNFLISVADNALAKTGGSFTLAAEMNFGSSFGILLPYIKSASANIAAAGVVRLANLNNISWRNAANGADVALTVSAADRLTLDTVVIPTISSTDTLTNKSISGATNTLSAIPNSATTAASANTASAIVARDGSGNFIAGTITAALSGNATTSSSTTGNAATVTTNANLTGDVTSVGNATTLVTVPITKGGTGQITANLGFAALSPMTTNGDIITRAGGIPTRLGIGTDGQVLGLLAGAPVWTDGGGGSGEKTYITNPSAKSVITGWIASNALLTVARTTTLAELPREFTTATGIKIQAPVGTQIANTHNVSFAFSLDDVDLSKKLKIQWSQKLLSGYVAGDFVVYIAAAASPQTVLYTPVTTAIPAAEGVFTTSFDAATTSALCLVIACATNPATDAGIVISDVVVGPGVGVQGAVVGPIESVTITSSNHSGSSTVTAFGQRIGEALSLKVRVLKDATAPSGASAVLITLPAGRTINTAVLPSSSLVGNAAFSGATFGPRMDAIAASTTTIRLLKNGTATNFLGSDFTASGEINYELMIPISEWAGSGTVNLAQNDNQFAADDGSADVFGQAGALVPNVAAAINTTSRAFSFPVTAQELGRVILEIKPSGAQWQSMADVYPFSAGNNSSTSNFYGVRGRWTSSTVYTVDFGNQGTRVSASNVTAGASDWASEFTAGTRFRARMESGGQAVGFGAATATSSGLVSAEESGTFTGTCTGFTANPTPTVYYTRVGKLVTIGITAFSGTSNSTSMTMTGIPAALRPARNWAEFSGIYCQNNSAAQYNCHIQIDTSGVITFYGPGFTGWTSASTKGLGANGPCFFTYSIA